MKTRILNQRGDTIVEVLISLTLITFVLAGAYWTASSSYRQERASQEHAEAITVAQTQIEALRIVGIHSVSNPSGFTPSGSPGTPSCLNGTATTASCYISVSGGTPSFNATCPASAYCYTVNIAPSATNPTYTVDSGHVTLSTYDVNVQWKALGGGVNQEDLYYRVDN